jgi:diguanylate cyclase (GGDEF)-like protein/PAS domain S-box-containing protein
MYNESLGINKMMANLKNFLLSGFEFEKEEYELRLNFILLNSILSILIVVLFFLFFMRYLRGEFLQAYLDLAAIFVSLFVLFIVRRSKKSINVAIPFLLTFFYILITITFNKIGILGTSWYIVLIVAAFFVKGKKVGLLFSSLSVISILTLEHLYHANYTFFEYTYIIIPLVLSVIFLYINEQRHEIVKTLLKKHKESLELEVQKQTKELSNLLQKSQELSSIMQNSQIEIYILDFETDIFLYANEGATKELGYSLQELKDMSFYDINSSVLKTTVEHFKEVMRKQNNAMNISTHRRKDGSSYGVQSFMHKIKFENKEAYVIFDIKISNVQQAQKEILRQKEVLSHQAHYDPLTKLPNRFLFYDRLSQAIIKAKRKGSKLAVLFIDLDHFKEINDTFGHDVGDTVLVEVAKRLQSCVRESDTVARLAGDEFLILIEDFDSKESIATIAQILINAMQVPIKYQDKELTITCSIGISIYPNDSNDPQTLIKFADSAMYRAKNIGKNNFKFYT